jgi:hypothetical protein
MSAKKSAGGSSKHEEQKYDVRDIVLAKIRGYPPWPAQVFALSISAFCSSLFSHIHPMLHRL